MAPGPGPLGAHSALPVPTPAPQELKLKDAECERLCRVRGQLERELEELTASLFEVRGGAGRRAGGGAAGRPSAPASHVEPAVFPGSPQDGPRSQHEAGGVRKAAEGDAGQGEARAGPDLLPTSEPCERRPPPPDRTLAWTGGPAGRGRGIRDGPTETFPLEWEPSSLGLELCFCCTTETFLGAFSGAGRILWPL